MTKTGNYVAYGIVATALMLMTIALASCSDEQVPPIEDQAPMIVEAPDNVEPETPIAKISPAEAWKAAQPALAQAEEAAKKLIEARLLLARKFFEAVSSKDRLEVFVDEILSYPAKFQLLKSGNEQFNRYVAETFQEKVVSERQLTKLFENVVIAYQADLDGCDNQLLLSLQTDADTAPVQAIDASKLLTPVRENFNEILQSSAIVAANDVVAEVLRQATSLFVMQGVSNAISKRFANTDVGDDSVNTMFSQLAGLAIGLVTDKVIERATSPKDGLVEKLHTSLGELSDRSIVNLRACLQNMANERATARRHIVSQAYGVE